MYLIELARTIQEEKERTIREAGRRRRLDWSQPEPSAQPEAPGRHLTAHAHRRPIRQP